MFIVAKKSYRHEVRLTEEENNILIYLAEQNHCSKTDVLKASLHQGGNILGKQYHTPFSRNYPKLIPLLLNVNNTLSKYEKQYDIEFTKVREEIEEVCATLNLLV